MFLIGALSAAGAGGGGGNYYVGLTTTAYNNFAASFNEFGGSNYLCGYTNAAGYTQGWFAKFSTEFDYQRVFTSSTTATRFGQAAYNGSGFWTTNWIDPARPVYFGDDGTINFQRQINGYDSGFDSAGAAQFASIVDSTGRLIVGIRQSKMSPFTLGGSIAFFNSSGTLTLNRLISGTNGHISTLAVDNSDSVVGTIGDRVFKLASGGSMTWSTILPAGDRGAETDGSNVFVVGNPNLSSFGFQSGLRLYKLNSSGTIQWQRSLGKASRNVYQQPRVSVDGEGNVYVFGYTGSVGPMKNIAKYDTDGNLLWQRRIYFTNTQDISIGGVGKIGFNSNGDMMLTWEERQSGISQTAFAILPADGSLTGSYAFGGQTLYYEEDDCSSVTTTLTASSGGLSAGGSSSTFSTPSFTFGTGSVTNDLIGL